MHFVESLECKQRIEDYPILGSKYIQCGIYKRHSYLQYTLDADLYRLSAHALLFD